MGRALALEHLVHAARVQSNHRSDLADAQASVVGLLEGSLALGLGLVHGSLQLLRALAVLLLGAENEDLRVGAGHGV